MFSKRSALWRIVPVANDDDPRWLDHPIWGEVMVRAGSAADARRRAAALDRRDDAGNDGRSGFDDEKLYAVRPVDGDRAAAFEGFPGPIVLSWRQRDAA